MNLSNFPSTKKYTFRNYKTHYVISKHKLWHLQIRLPPTKYLQKECPQVSMPEVIHSDNLTALSVSFLMHLSLSIIHPH